MRLRGFPPQGVPVFSYIGSPDGKIIGTSPGPQGPKGDPGPAGPQGDVGPQGPIGNTGPAGPKGDTGSQGPQGIQGPKGDTGLQGPQGVQGPKGDKGDTGDTGPQGLQGPKGDGLEIDTTVANYAALPASPGAAGYTAFVQNEGRLYVWSGTAWPAQGTGALIQGQQGPQGDPGPTGPAGTNGTNGATVTSGSGAPSGGADGDHYVRTSNWDVYKKTSGVWSVIGNIKGADGAPGSGGGGLSYTALLGAIAAGTKLTVPHGLNTKNLLPPLLVRTYLQAGALSSAAPGEVIQVNKWDIVDDNNATIDFVNAWAANELRIIWNAMAKPAGWDSTGPNPATLASGTVGLTDVSLTITHGTDAGGGTAGTYLYRNNTGTGTPIATIPVGTTAYTDTGRTQNTAYSYSARSFDLDGNPSPTLSNVVTVTTLVPSNVAPIGTVVENRVAGTTATVRPTYASGSLRIAVALVELNHSNWFNQSTYTTKVTGTQSGDWTQLPPGATLPDVGGNFGQPSGGVRIFYKLMPNTAWTADDVTVSKVAGSQDPTITQACIKIRQFEMVDQVTPFGSPVVSLGNAPISATVASNAGDYTLFCAANNSTGPTSNNGYNKTMIGTYQGADTAGYADYFMAGEAATTTTGNVTHSLTGPNMAFAVMAVNLRKAS